MAGKQIRLLLADVDGTLVTNDKVLTERAIAAVKKLKAVGVLFAITSGRPHRGMSMLIEPLELTTSIAAFNGGVFVRPDMSVIEQHTVPDDVTPAVIELLDGLGVDVWVYRGADWFVRDRKAPHVDREAWTVKFEPSVVANFGSVSDQVAKVVAVNDDYDKVQSAVDAVRGKFGDHVSAANIPALLRRYHQPGGQQGRRGQVPVESTRYPARRDSHHRRPAQRRPHVRPLRSEHRHGERQPGSPEGGSSGDDLQ